MYRFYLPHGPRNWLFQIFSDSAREMHSFLGFTFRHSLILGGVCNETPDENRNISMFECQFSMFQSSLNILE